jgi:hypothetical protein
LGQGGASGTREQRESIGDLRQVLERSPWRARCMRPHRVRLLAGAPRRRRQAHPANNRGTPAPGPAPAEISASRSWASSSRITVVDAEIRPTAIAGGTPLAPGGKNVARPVERSDLRRVLQWFERELRASDLEEPERREAKERQREGGRKKGSGKFPDAQKTDSRDRIATACGVSAPTLKKIRAVVEAAEKEPERFAPLVAEMDRTGRVNGVARKLERARAADRVKALPREPIKMAEGSPRPPGSWPEESAGPSENGHREHSGRSGHGLTKRFRGGILKVLRRGVWMLANTRRTDPPSVPLPAPRLSNAGLARPAGVLSSGG